MELRHLRYFVAVAHSLNFTKAADSLHISQPPLSRQIQEFEEEVGTALFERQGKKTSLTAAGEYLFVEAERLLEGIESACRTAKAIADKSRSLRIGCVNFFLNTDLAPFLEKLRGVRPELKMEILIMSTEAQKRALLSGSLDIGFVRSWVRNEGLDFVPIAKEPLALIFPDSFGLSGEPADCLAALASRPFVAMARATAPGLFEKIAETCAAYGISPRVDYQCNDAYSIIGLVGSGLGWSIVPDLEFVDAKATGISSVRLPQFIVIGLCFRPDRVAEDAREFIELAKGHFAWTEAGDGPRA